MGSHLYNSSNYTSFPPQAMHTATRKQTSRCAVHDLLDLLTRFVKVTCSESESDTELDPDVVKCVCIGTSLSLPWAHIKQKKTTTLKCSVIT